MAALAGGANLQGLARDDREPVRRGFRIRGVGAGHSDRPQKIDARRGASVKPSRAGRLSSRQPW